MCQSRQRLQALAIYTPIWRFHSNQMNWPFNNQLPNTHIKTVITTKIMVQRRLMNKIGAAYRVSGSWGKPAS
jgi:hypothetical protein